VLRRLFKVSDSGRICKYIHDRVKAVIRHKALVLSNAHAPKNLGKRKPLENYLFLERRIIRQFDHSKSRHERRRDLILVVGRRDRIDTGCRNVAFNVIVGKAQIVEQCEQNVCRIAVALSGGCLIELVDDKDKVGLSRSSKCLHNNTGFRVRINPGAACQLLRIIDGAHIERRPREFENTCDSVGDLRLAGTGRADEQQTVSRQRVRAVDLNNRLDNALLDPLHAIELLVEDPACFYRINGLEIIALPLNIHHDGQSSLGMPSLFLRHFTGPCDRQVAAGPEANLIWQSLACAHHKVGD